ncbi:hypothetical protein SAMN04488568_102164 [Maricaulis salignorans]|uniref:Uncharacterized protein n=1 Tax=Maricaulis salignorans TaxID=144026 RepID=A0A1G9MZE7_9PROT|nr:hypothetical protein SAMN04488568_102164 [Maricaulis salignorans]
MRRFRYYPIRRYPRLPPITGLATAPSPKAVRIVTSTGQPLPSPAGESRPKEKTDDNIQYRDQPSWRFLLQSYSVQRNIRVRKCPSFRPDARKYQHRPGTNHDRPSEHSRIYQAKPEPMRPHRPSESQINERKPDGTTTEKDRQERQVNRSPPRHISRYPLAAAVVAAPLALVFAIQPPPRTRPSSSAE